MPNTMNDIRAAGRARPRTGLIAAAGLLALAVTLPATAADLDTVKVANSSPTLNAAPLLLADADPSVFADHGIELEITHTRGSSANCVTALISEAVDICMVGHGFANDAIAEGADLKVIAITTRPMSEIFISKKAADASGVAADAPADDRLKALEGLRIASCATGCTHWTYLQATLNRVGLSVDDVTYTTLIDPVAMMEGIRHDQIDGAMWSVGSLGGLLGDGAGVRWFSMTRGDAPELNDIPFVGVYARSDWIEANPDLVQRIHDAYADSISRLKNDTENSSALIKEMYYPDLDAAVWDDAFEQAVPAFFDGAQGVRSGWEKLLAFQTANTGKDYSSVSFDEVVLPMARAD